MSLAPDDTNLKTQSENASKTFIGILSERSGGGHAVLDIWCPLRATPACIWLNGNYLWDVLYSIYADVLIIVLIAGTSF